MTNNQSHRAGDGKDLDGGDLPCPRCNGSGFELQWSDNSPDANQVEVNCDHCDGAGSLGAAYTHLSQALKRERERNKAAGNELHWLKSGPFFGLRADKSIQTVADRLDELADACSKYDQRSERSSDIRAAAAVWRKHFAGPAAAPAAAPAWQPIETAPLDDLVLLHSDTRGRTPTLGRWRDYHGINQPRFSHWLAIPAVSVQAPATRSVKDRT